MFDPFAAALDALFNAPGSAAAIFQPVDGAPVAIRVIRGRPDAAVSFQQSRIVQATNSFEIRRSEVNSPAPRDFVVIGAAIIDDEVVGGEPFELYGDPMIDLEGMTWLCGAEPVTE